MNSPDDIKSDGQSVEKESADLRIKAIWLEAVHKYSALHSSRHNPCLHLNPDQDAEELLSLVSDKWESRVMKFEVIGPVIQGILKATYLLDRLCQTMNNIVQVSSTTLISRPFPQAKQFVAPLNF
jgi:hypothetical protein